MIRLMSEYVRQNITYHCKNSESKLQIKTDDNKVLNLKNSIKLKTVIKQDECMVSPQQLFCITYHIFIKLYSLKCFKAVLYSFSEWNILSNKLKTADSLLPSQHLFVQSQQQKHQNNVWNLFKVNNKVKGTTAITFFCFIVNFEQISRIVLVFLLFILNK